MKLRGRRVRSPDGQRRASRIHRFRDLDPATDVKIRALAQHFGVPLGSIVDAAVADFFAHVMAQADSGTRGSGSPVSAGVESEIKTLDAWMQMRELSRLSPGSRAAADGLDALEADLSARRSKLKDDLTKIR